MPNSAYMKGYRFERQVMQDIALKLKLAGGLKQVYMTRAAGSRGIADIILCGTTSSNQAWVGVQCKNKYMSKQTMQRAMYNARVKYGMYLVFAFRENRKLTYYPESPVTALYSLLSYQQGGCS